mgnify:FL=1
MRILLAEDDRSLSNAICTILKYNNYSVDAVYDGQEALDYLESNIYDAGDDYELELELDGFNLISSNDAAISITSGDKIILSIKKSTSNYVYDLRDSENSTAAIYSLSDLDIQWKGSLEVTSNGKGIHTKDDLKVKNVALKINAYDDALRGNDSVKIESGDLELISRVGDGIKTSNSDVSSKGN